MCSQFAFAVVVCPVAGDPRLAGKTTASGTPANAPKNYSVKIRPAGEITDDEREHISNLRLDRGLLSKLRELKAAGGTAPVPGDKSKWVKIGDMFVDLGADASTVKQLQTGNGFTIQFFPSYRINVKKQVCVRLVHALAVVVIVCVVLRCRLLVRRRCAFSVVTSQS